MKHFGLAREPKASDVALDRVECADAPECFEHALRLGGLGFNELATQMRLLCRSR
jgi:hypothetical protein